MYRAPGTKGAVSSALVLATAGGLLTAAGTTASAVTNCTSPVYKRQFYANTTFSGTPKKTDCDSAIDQNWGSGAPASGLPADNFGVRWTVTRDFGSGGPFSLPVTTQDGIRVYLDGVRKVDLWKNVSATRSKTVNLSIPSGKHTLRVDFVNWTGKANITFAYKPVTSASTDKIKPLVPTGSAASYDTATGRAKVSWSRNQEMDLAGYRVYRRLGGGSAWTLRTTTTATSYTDTSLPATGATYYYEVRAHDKAGNESTGTTDRPVTTTDRTAPARVTGLAGQGTTAGNALTWQASSADVDHYEVWAAPPGRNDPDGPEPVFGTSYTDPVAEAGTGYRYTVQAVDGAGNISPVSDGVTLVRPEDSTAPVPTSVLGTPADASTRVSWTPAQDPDATVTGFHVYRRTSAQGAWILVGGAGATAVSYDDTAAPKGTAYYYVASVDGGGAESSPSARTTVDRLTPATATGPAAPRLTVVSEGGTRFPISVGVRPGTGDEARLLKGYSWDVSGACGSSGTLFSASDTLSWTPQYTGPCTVSVRAVDAYGRTGEHAASVEVMVNR
ncbi:fibronectin type III domain-containing protein [Streptomyces sp. NPDC096324]|uniref:fibronectin type III domain-containing protein n=1 Tax=Streptomyces sp. NPDC096324 TaxID=3366085 RepID=UPI003817499D